MMFDSNESGQNIDAKPDIVTCNSVLNACAFETGCSKADRRTTMDIVVNTFETFQSASPLYGSPDHVTYAQVLLAISKHMSMDETRRKLAETTFYQVSCRRPVDLFNFLFPHDTLTPLISFFFLLACAVL